MEIEGKIINFLGEQSGTSKAGNLWKKKEYVLETFGNYPRKVKFHIFGDRADTILLEPGRDYVLSFDLESREFNGRWYTDVSVYGARDYVANQQQSFGNPQGGNFNNQGYQAPQGGNMQFGGQQGSGFQVNNDQFTANAGESDEDLPF
ncbi:MAG: DUF3127 domain-containing protein [Muribaculaceae bacterium]|nr:DUF3127 domain-containing protein [Muribaculaceae bacterium]